jgi:16S rRNA (adenine1518-N6/adenine1519-N6)-dimethyltransferase
VTEMLLQEAGTVLAVEIDKALMPFLQETLSEYPNFTLWHMDVLKADLGSWIREQQAAGYRSIKVVGNLPYYVTTPIIMKLLEDRLPIDLMLFMMQKEVAQRLAAKPSHKGLRGPDRCRAVLLPWRKKFLTSPPRSSFQNPTCPPLSCA